MGPPPSAPPPPPPPIADIPQRGTPTHTAMGPGLKHTALTTHQAAQQRAHGRGPTLRGNYSDIENLRLAQCQQMDHGNIRRQYSDSETCFSHHSCGGNHYSGGDGSEYEPHYLVKTPNGDVFIPQSQGNIYTFAFHFQE